MSMGDSGYERFVDSRGGVHVNRVPARVLNAFVKASLLVTLKRDDVFVEEHRRPGSDEYIVKDATGKTLFMFDNAWDYGYYSISANGKKLAEMDWYENDNNTNPQQQDIFDVLQAVIDKSNETRRIEQARNDLTPDEIQALQSMGIQNVFSR